MIVIMYCTYGIPGAESNVVGNFLPESDKATLLRPPLKKAGEATAPCSTFTKFRRLHVKQ